MNASNPRQGVTSPVSGEARSARWSQDTRDQVTSPLPPLQTHPVWGCGELRARCWEARRLLLGRAAESRCVIRGLGVRGGRVLY